VTDRQTDGQTDGIAVASTALAMLALAMRALRRTVKTDPSSTRAIPERFRDESLQSAIQIYGYFTLLFNTD